VPVGLSVVGAGRSDEDAAMATARRADLFIDLEDDPREDRPRLGDERATLVEAPRSARLTLEMKVFGP
jgi:hypothetical protein